MLLLDVQHSFDGVDGIARAEVSEEFPVSSGEEAVDTGEPPSSPTGPVPHKGRARVADDRPVFRIGSVLLVAEYRVAVAYAIHKVEHGSHGRVPDEVLGAKSGPDHRFGIGDHLRRDPLYLR